MIQKKEKDGVKKIGILAGKIGDKQSKKLKIRRSPNREEQDQQKAIGENPLDFTTDMKRIGIMDDIKEGQEKQKKLIIKQRHVSPPPPASIGPLIDPVSSANHNSEAKLDCDIKDDTPNQNTKKIKINIKNQKVGGLFKFPFQRRARSLSLPKDKDGNDIESDTPPTENQQKQDEVAMKMA